MANNNRLKNNIQPLSKTDRKISEKVCNQLIKINWSPESNYDNDWGWVILAGKTFSGYGHILRRIKYYPLYSTSDFWKAVKLQHRVRKDLVEVVPCKPFLGNKISLPEFNDNMIFLTEADFKFWSKFFKSKKITHEMTSIDEAGNLGVYQ